MSDPPPGPPAGGDEPGWAGAPPPTPPPVPPPAPPPPAAPPPSAPLPPASPAPGPPDAGPPAPFSTPPPGYGPPPGGWPGAAHDPTAGYGSAGPWSEHQAATSGYYPPWVSATQTEPLAGWSLGVSIFSLVCCQLTAPVAIVLAVMAMRRIDARPQQLTGRGLAVAGLVIGIIGTAFLVLQIVLAASGSSTMWTPR